VPIGSATAIPTKTPTPSGDCYAVTQISSATYSAWRQAWNAQLAAFKKANGVTGTYGSGGSLWVEFMIESPQAVLATFENYLVQHRTLNDSEADPQGSKLYSITAPVWSAYNQKTQQVCGMKPWVCQAGWWGGCQ
jgi:hypothetical protein